MASLERAAIGGSFEVAMNGVNDMNSIIPPAKINDLRRGQMAEDSVELTWTAVGASMNDGTGNVFMQIPQYYSSAELKMRMSRYVEYLSKKVGKLFENLIESDTFGNIFYKVLGTVYI